MTEAVQLSLKGALFIGAFEGFRAKPYTDAVGVWTIGYGHTHGVGPHTAPITRARAAELLVDDAAGPAKAARGAAARTLKQHELDALTSFGFNLGAGIFDPSHTIGRELRKRRVTRRRWKRKVAAAILMYDQAGGHALAGLTRRRRAERRLWLTGSYSTA